MIFLQQPLIFLLVKSIRQLPNSLKTNQVLNVTDQLLSKVFHSASRLMPTELGQPFHKLYL